MSEVKISRNTEKQEVERVFSLFEEMEFYRKNNYQLSLPDNISNDSTNEEIRRQVSSEYNLDRFKLNVDEIVMNWRKIEKDFFENIQKVLQINPLPVYECLITQYGTGGSYNPPNNIILNIRSSFFGFYAIAHETIHLLIHDLIEKHNIDHWQKERLVDNYFFEILNIDKFQTIPTGVNVQGVDAIFQRFSSKGAEFVIHELHSMKKSES